MPPNTSSSERARRANWLAGVEATVVFAMILLYIWRVRFLFPYAWIPILALVFISHLHHRESFRTLGFVRSSKPRGLARLWTALALIAITLLATGVIFRTFRQVSWKSAFFSLALYCVWGLFQQYVLNGFFVNRFSEALPNHARAVPVLAGVFFCVAHLPNWFLMIVAVAGGFVCARVYLKYRDLYFLGVAHGVVGFLIYLVVPDTISHHLYVGPKWFSM